MELDYFLVDVFTEKPLSGNPLAVVLNTVDLTTDAMQSIAREFNLSETTFVERRSYEREQAEGVRVRIFTTQEELPFAGHPTLGTASVLKLHAPETLSNGLVRLALNVGTVPVRFSGEGLFAAMTQKDPEFGAQLESAEVARLIGLRAEDLDPRLPPQIVSTGNAFAIVALTSDRPLARLKVDQAAATAWLREREARWFYVLGPEQEKPAAWRARMQFYGGEDPATGSAAGCAISFLVQHGAVRSGRQISLRQGIEIGRPSEMVLSAQLRDARVTDVSVAGSTVLVAKGQLFLP